MNDDFHQGGDVDPYRIFYDYTLNFLNDDSSLLNLGCGSMKYEETVKKSFNNITITSIDKDGFFKKNSEKTDNFQIIDIEKPFHLGSFDCITFFEVVEHIDCTDQLFQNCYNNLKTGGLLIFSFPNLSSIYGRIELLLGYQPHILEISNENSLFGTGIFGKLNSGLSIYDKTPQTAECLHHIRGITYKSMVEFISYHNFYLKNSVGFPRFFKMIPSLAPNVVMICEKQ